MSDSTNTSTMASIVNHSIRDGIYIAHVIYTFEQILAFSAAEAIVLDPTVQREKVKNHPGSAQQLLDSLSDSFPIGAASGYVNGPQAPTDQGRTLTNSAFIREFVPSKDHPIQLTDWGHRLRWSVEIHKSGVIKIGTYTLLQLKESDPETYAVVMGSEVPLALVFHTSGTVPRAYIARMFRALQLSAPAVVGERAKASDDEGLVNAGEALVNAISGPAIGRKVPDARGVDRATSHALVIGAIYPDRMSLKTKDLERITAMSDADLKRSSEVVGRFITALTNVKTELMTNAEVSDNIFKAAEAAMKIMPKKSDARKVAEEALKPLKQNKQLAGASHEFFKKCKFDLALDAVMIHGCSVEPDAAVGYIERFFRVATKNKSSWEMMTAAVTAHTSAARSFNADVWTTRWTTLKRLIGEVKAE